MEPFAGKSLERWEAKDLLQIATEPVLKSAYSHFVAAKPGEDARMIGGAMLVIGHDVRTGILSMRR